MFKHPKSLSKAISRQLTYGPTTSRYYITAQKIVFLAKFDVNIYATHRIARSGRREGLASVPQTCQAKSLRAARLSANMINTVRSTLFMILFINS